LIKNEAIKTYMEWSYTSRYS